MLAMNEKPRRGSTSITTDEARGLKKVGDPRRQEYVT
jgi:hypothetical protein